MERAVTQSVRDDLSQKIVLITGPRQTGKTTLAKMLSPAFDYFNYDLAEDRLRLRRKSWDRRKPLIIFDELHKMRGWKAWLKGIFDSEGIPPALVVTGSARLDTSRRVGDSLAGRYFRYRLHPFDIRELRREIEPAEAFARLMRFGGFPEPFLRASERFYKRWRQSHTDIILRQDLLELEALRDIQGVETLAELLKHRVGSAVSAASLARDLERDAKTVKRWLVALENLYVIFRVPPFHRSVARALLKAPKYYFFDNALVQNGDGAKLENLVACALVKELNRIQDVDGDQMALHYLRTKDGREIDFLITKERAPTLMIEVKWGDETPSSHFAHFGKQLPRTRQIQLVHTLRRPTTYPDGPEVRALVPWLTGMPDLAR